MSSDYSERTVRIGGIQYVDPKGVWRFGLQGSKVKVHPDNVERFDTFNGSPATPVEAVEPTAPEPVPAVDAEEPKPRRTTRTRKSAESED